MARGFLSGALLGGVLSVVVAGVVSVIAPPPRTPEVSDSAPGAVQAPSVAEAPSAAPSRSSASFSCSPGQGR